MPSHFGREDFGKVLQRRKSSQGTTTETSPLSVTSPSKAYDISGPSIINLQNAFPGLVPCIETLNLSSLSSSKRRSIEF